MCTRSGWWNGRWWGCRVIHGLAVSSCTGAVISLASLPRLLGPWSPSTVLPISRASLSLACLKDSVPRPSPLQCPEALQHSILTHSPNKSSPCDLYLWPQGPPSPLRGPPPTLPLLPGPLRYSALCGFSNALLSISSSLPEVPLPLAGELLLMPPGPASKLLSPITPKRVSPPLVHSRSLGHP